MLEAQSLAFIDVLTTVQAPILRSRISQYGVPDLGLGSRLITLPDLAYLRAYWGSPVAGFVPFLLRVKRRHGPQDVFRFVQSIPLRNLT